MADRDFDVLLEKAKRIQMTPDQREQQRRSFAYGNANIENPSVTREIVDKAAQSLVVGRESLATDPHT